MIVKPSEVTPLSTIRLTKLLAEAQVPAGVVNLVLGAGSVVGALVASPDVDLVSLTGGIATGTQIMRTAAGTGTRVALELGGKYPNIVFADAAFDAAVDYALAAAFLHSGQVCSAGARLLVQDDLHDAFPAAVVDRASRIRLGNGLDERSEVGPSIPAGAGGAVSSAGSRLIIGSRRSTTNLAAASALSTVVARVETSEWQIPCPLVISSARRGAPGNACRGCHGARPHRRTGQVMTTRG
jgi:betaine-aldehyde dehydrogenase